MAMGNSCETGTLKFDDAMGVLLSEEARRTSSGLAETSESALSVDRRGRLMNRKKKKNAESKSGRGVSKSRGAGCWRCSENGHIQRDFKKKKEGEGKNKEKDSMYVTESDGSDILILSWLVSVNHG